MKTEYDFLEEIRQTAIYNLSCYSEDTDGHIPKAGYEKEHADALSDIEVASRLMVLVNMIDNDLKTAYTGFVQVNALDNPAAFEFKVPKGATEKDIECLAEKALWKSGVVDMWHERGAEMKTKYSPKQRYKYEKPENQLWNLINACLMTACTHDGAVATIKNNILTISLKNGVTITVENFIGNKEVQETNDISKCYKNLNKDCLFDMGHNCAECEGGI